MSDPTYVKADIEARPEWKLAFRMSELDNDHAPIGWGRYIPLAELALGYVAPPAIVVGGPNGWYVALRTKVSKRTIFDKVTASYQVEGQPYRSEAAAAEDAALILAREL